MIQMTTETVEKTSIPFSIENGKSELASLNTQYDALMSQLIPAGAAGDVALMTKLGSEMADIAVKRDKLAKRINRAENGTEGGTVAAKIEARKNAFDALTNFFLTPESDAIRTLLNVASNVKTIKINIENGAIAGFDVVGGFRTVTKTGIKRPRASWVEASNPTAEGMPSKDIRALYGVKYGQVKSEDAMTPAERNALLAKIVEGEKLVNKNAAE